MIFEKLINKKFELIDDMYYNSGLMESINEATVSFNEMEHNLSSFINEISMDNLRYSTNILNKFLNEDFVNIDERNNVLEIINESILGSMIGGFFKMIAGIFNFFSNLGKKISGWFDKDKSKTDKCKEITSSKSASDLYGSGSSSSSSSSSSSKGKSIKEETDKMVENTFKNAANIERKYNDKIKNTAAYKMIDKFIFDVDKWLDSMDNKNIDISNEISKYKKEYKLKTLTPQNKLSTYRLLKVGLDPVLKMDVFLDKVKGKSAPQKPDSKVTSGTYSSINFSEYINNLEEIEKTLKQINIVIDTPDKLSNIDMEEYIVSCGYLVKNGKDMADKINMIYKGGTVEIVKNLNTIVYKISDAFKRIRGLWNDINKKIEPYIGGKAELDKDLDESPVKNKGDKFHYTGNHLYLIDNIVSKLDYNGFSSALLLNKDFVYIYSKMDLKKIMVAIKNNDNVATLIKNEFNIIGINNPTEESVDTYFNTNYEKLMNNTISHSYKEVLKLNDFKKYEKKIEIEDLNKIYKIINDKKFYIDIDDFKKSSDVKAEKLKFINDINVDEISKNVEDDSGESLSLIKAYMKYIKRIFETAAKVDYAGITITRTLIDDNFNILSAFII